MKIRLTIVLSLLLLIFIYGCGSSSDGSGRLSSEAEMNSNFTSGDVKVDYSVDVSNSFISKNFIISYPESLGEITLDNCRNEINIVMGTYENNFGHNINQIDLPKVKNNKYVWDLNEKLSIALTEFLKIYGGEYSISDLNGRTFPAKIKCIDSPNDPDYPDSNDNVYVANYTVSFNLIEE